MARNRTAVDASPETVFAVLANPSRYAYFVVGTKTVRRFDPNWPEPGSAFHHTLGVGLPLLRDATISVAVDPPRQLVLKTRLMPLGMNDTVFRLTPEGDGTLVELEEKPIAGPAAAKAIAPLVDRLLWLRNQELLRRLRKTVERRGQILDRHHNENTSGGGGQGSSSSS
jgi:uncharacterized protein YndB with AHSA1/START domain